MGVIGINYNPPAGDRRGIKMERPNEIDGDQVIYYVEMQPEAFGYTPDEARDRDMPMAYAIVTNSDANAGIIVYAIYDNGEGWIINPWGTRYLTVILMREAQAAVQAERDRVMAAVGPATMYARVNGKLADFILKVDLKNILFPDREPDQGASITI